MMNLNRFFYRCFCIYCAALLVGCTETPDPDQDTNPDQDTTDDFESALSAGAHFPKVAQYNLPTPIDTVIGNTSVGLTDSKGVRDWYFPYDITKQHEYSDNIVSCMHLSENVDAVWPGNLIQGSSFRSGKLASIPLYSFRKPGKITLALISGADVEYTREVSMNGYSSVNGAINGILSDYQKAGGGFTGRTFYTDRRVHSKEQLMTFWGSDDKKVTDIMSDVNWQSETIKIAIKLSQVFFTIKYDDPEGFRGMFTDKITGSDIKPYSSHDNPVCYIASVDYGRVYMLLYEFKVASRLPSALSDLMHVVSDPDVPITFLDLMAFNNSFSSVKLFQYGGDQQAGLDAAMNPNKLRRFVVDGAKFSKENPGMPMEYRAFYLDDATPISRPAQFNVRYTETMYVPEPKSNKVSFRLDRISVDPVKALDRANVPRARYSIPEFRVDVLNESNNIESTHTLAGLYDVTFNRDDPPRLTNLQGEFNIPTLGVDTKKRLRFSFSVYITLAVATGSGSAKDRMQQFDYTLDFEYDVKTQRWKPVRRSGLHWQMQESPFQTVTVAGNVHHGLVNWNLAYSFSANHIDY